MEVFDGHFYKNCKRFMMLIGIWPYQTNTTRLLSSIIFLGLNLTLSVPQVILLVQKFGKDMTVTFENTVSVMFSIGVMGKFTVTCSSMGRLNALLVQIAKDWQRLTDPAEREILTKLSTQGLFLSLFYIYYVFLAWILYTLMPFLPVALDLIVPLNQSRPPLMPFYADYVFFEQTDHHYFSCVHIAVVYLGCFFLFAGIDSTYVITVKHTCGLFEIVCHRLKNMVKIEKDAMVSKLVDDKAIVRNLGEAIQLHNETIRCCQLLEDSYNLVFLMVNCMSVLGLALSFVYLLFIYEDLFKFIRVVAFVIGLIIHLLYLNYVGQQIIDSSEEVFLSAYSSNWYHISNQGRKMVGIILIRSLTPCTLTAGGLSILCMESFGILLKTTMSYFTVILSVSE